MKVIRAPRPLLYATSTLFVLVPLAVLTAGVFSKRAWWDVSIQHLGWAGWVALACVAPLSWRMAMGRRGAWEALAWGCGLVCFLLLVRSGMNRNTLQALWSVGVTAVCVALLFWTKKELNKSYFEPGLSWFQGLPTAIPDLRARVLGEPTGGEPLRVCRLDEEGLFAFATQGQIVPQLNVELELYQGDPLDERKVRIKGWVVRQFESRVFEGRSGDWGMGVCFHPMSPDLKKDFRDFLEVLRGEGYIFR
jgi:hypothetical protein